MASLQKVVFSSNKRIELIYKGLGVFITIDREKNHIRISSIVFSEEDFLPQAVSSCVDESRARKQPSFASYLHADESSPAVWFVQEVPLHSQAPLFLLLTSFCGIATFWGKILKKRAYQDLMA